MQKYLSFKDPLDVIALFRGQILIQREYASEIEAQSYVGDLMFCSKLGSALGEVESDEATITKAGYDFFKYAFKNSDLEIYLKSEVYRDNYIKNKAFFLRPVNCVNGKIDPMGRILSMTNSSEDVTEFLEFFKLDMADPQNQIIKSHDIKIRFVQKSFEEVFTMHEYKTYRLCRASKNFKGCLSYLYLFRQDFTLRFKPHLYIQINNIGTTLNSNYETLVIPLPVDPETLKDEDFETFSKTIRYFFDSIYELTEMLISMTTEQLNNYLEENNIHYKKIPSGKNLWVDIFSH